MRVEDHVSTRLTGSPVLYSGVVYVPSATGYMGKDFTLPVGKDGERVHYPKVAVAGPGGIANMKAFGVEKPYTLVLANNRRVDIILSTTGQESSRQYPFKAEDFSTLVNRNGIPKDVVQMAAEKQKIEN